MGLPEIGEPPSFRESNMKKRRSYKTFLVTMLAMTAGAANCNSTSSGASAADADTGADGGMCAACANGSTPSCGASFDPKTTPCPHPPCCDQAGRQWHCNCGQAACTWMSYCGS